MALQSGRFAMAEALLKEAVALQPQDAEAWMLLGIACLQQGASDRGVIALAQSLKINPLQAETRYNHAYGLAQAGRLAEAAESYELAIKLSPKDPEVRMAQAKVLVDLKCYTEAQTAFSRALELAPNNPDGWNNLGNALFELHQEEEALAAFGKALSLRPAFPDAYFNRGKALSTLDRYADALASYDQALALRPGYPEARWHQSWIQLLLGNFKAGWSLFEARWEVAEFADQRRNFTSKLWLGQAALDGSHILLYAEQGLGDTLQFVRYVPQLLSMGAKITLEVQPLLVNLLKDQWPGVQVLPKGAVLPVSQWHCPLMSLPFALGTTLETVPHNVPYLHCSPDWVPLEVKHPKVKHPKVKRPLVGLVWSGNPGHKNDHNRSLALATLAPLLACDADFVTLQPELRAEDTVWLEAHPQVSLQQVALSDFTQTAALIEQLDWVITVDTSVAHLAGALGKPFWLLLPIGPDYRWLLEREDSPWYPTARLFRQKARGTWPEVIERVVAATQDTITKSQFV